MTLKHLLSTVVLLLPLPLTAQPTFDWPAESNERRKARIVHYSRSDGHLAVKVYRDGLLVVQRSGGTGEAVRDYEHQLSPRELQELVSAIATNRWVDRLGGEVTRELSGLLDEATRRRIHYEPRSRLQLSLKAGSVPGREDRLAFDLELPGSLTDYARAAPEQPAVRMLRRLVAPLERLSHHPSLTEVPIWHRQWTAADTGLPAAPDGLPATPDGASTLWLDWHMLLDLDCFLGRVKDDLEVVALPGRQQLEVEIVRTPVRLNAPRRTRSAPFGLPYRSPYPAGGSFFVLRPDAPPGGTAELSLTVDGQAFCRHGTKGREPVSGIEQAALTQPWTPGAAIYFDFFQPTLETATIRDGSILLLFSEVLVLESVEREIRLDGRPTRWLKSHDGMILRSREPVAPGPHTLTIGTGPLDRGGRGPTEPVEISFEAEADQKIWAGGQTRDPRPAADVTTASPAGTQGASPEATANETEARAPGTPAATRGRPTSPLPGNPPGPGTIREWLGEGWSRSTPASALGSRQVIGVQLRETLPLDDVRRALLARPDTLTDAAGTPVAFESDRRQGCDNLVEIRPTNALEPGARYRLRIYDQVLINPRDVPKSRRQVEVEFLGSELPLLVDRFPPVVRKVEHWYGFPELWLSKQVPIEKLAAAVTLDGRRVAWIHRREGELHRYRSLEQLGLGEHVLEVDDTPLDYAGQPILKRVRLSFEVVPWISASLCRDPDSGLGKRSYVQDRTIGSMIPSPGCPEPPRDR